MHFSKIYLQDNFVPNIVEDQFRRKVIGVEISLNEGDNLDEAKQEGEKYIQDYIAQNKVYPDHQHVEVKLVSEPIGEIMVDRKNLGVNYQTVIEEINKCETIEDLEGWNMIAKGNHEAGMAFAKRAAFLLSPDNKQLKLKKLKQIKP